MVSDTPLFVGVTGLQAGFDPSPGLAVARALRRMSLPNLRLIGLDYDPACTGLFAEDLFEACYVLPWQPTSTDTLEALLAIKRALGLDVFIPCLDSDVHYWSRMQTELYQNNISVLLPSYQSLTRCTKTALVDLAPLVGMDVPPTIVCHDWAEVEASLEVISPPAIIKGFFSGTLIGSNRDMLEVQARAVARVLGYPIVIQAFVQGEEYSVCGLANQQSECIVTICQKKIGITDEGSTWMGVTVDSPELNGICKLLVQELGWVGPFDVDILRDKDNRSWLLLDFNPRFPSWVDGAINAGINMPTVALELMVQLPEMRNVSATSGIVVVKDFEDIMLRMSELGANIWEGDQDERYASMYRRV